MKKNILLLLLALLIGGTAFYLMKKNGTSVNGNTALPDRNFKVEDVDQIGRITIQQPKYPLITFYRSPETSNEWRMNNNKKVNEYVLNDFLGLIKSVEVNYIPTKAMTKTIKDSFKENGVEIKIYDKSGTLIRDFLVGSEIGDASGTPFMIRGYDQPYVLRIPGFVGSLRTRIVNKMNEWESKTIYELKPADILSIEVLYHRDENASYKISKSENTYKISKPNQLEKLEDINQKTAEAYFSRFTNIVAEANDSENPERGTINNYQTFATVSIQLVDGSESIVRYISYADISRNFDTKSPHQIHPDNKFFAESNDGEMYLVQQRVIWPVFRTYDYFKK